MIAKLIYHWTNYQQRYPFIAAFDVVLTIALILFMVFA